MTTTRRNPLAAREAQPVALASEGKQINRLAPDQIRADGGTQMRAGLSMGTVEEYVESFIDPDVWPFPPVVVFHDGTDYWLGDGFHRVEAARRFMARHPARGQLSLTVPAEVRPGTRRDAILYAAAANADHGLRRTNADKRRAVEVLLNDEEWCAWSDREIARRCKVSNNFVSELRRSLSSDDSEKPVERAYTTKHGTQATMQTKNIGATKPAPAPPSAAPARGKCRVCGRPLTDPASVADACGPACAAKLAQQAAYQGSDGQAMIEASEAYAAATLAAMAAGNIPDDVAAALVEPVEDDAPTSTLPSPAGAWVRKFGSVIPAGALADDDDAIDDDVDVPPACPPDLAAAGWTLRTMARTGKAPGWWLHNQARNLATSVYDDQGAAIAEAHAKQNGVGVRSATMIENDKRQIRIRGELSFWRDALGRADAIGELTGHFTLTAPLRREIEKAIYAYEGNVAE